MPGTSLQGTTQTFDAQYGDHPWAGLDRNQRQWYDPVLRDVYRKLNVFGQFTSFTQNNGAVNARTMTISGLYDIQANTDPLGVRQMWLPAAHVDSWQVDVTFSDYGNKLAYHKYDRIITYWRTNGKMNMDTLAAITNDKLGQNIADTLDLLSRNSLLDVPYQYFGASGQYTKISDITTADTFQTSTLEEIHLGMQNRDVPYSQNPSGDIGSIVCITSPAIEFDLKRQADPKAWLYRAAYAQAQQLWNMEIGSFQNVRFVRTPKCTLWNSGAVTYQTTVSAPISAGDGAPAGLVDRTRRVGQAGSVHFIQLAAGADMTQYAVNDIVTLHILRGDGSVNNITSGGVDWTDGTLQNLRITSINVGARQLTFASPIMVPFAVDLGAGVYAYLTKGVHIHASIFLGGPDAIAVGIGRPLELHFPPPVDDRESMYRVSWDIYAGWNKYNPLVAEVVFTAGSTRVVGGLIQ